MDHVLVLGRRRDRHGPGVRHVREQRAEGDEGGDADRLGELQQLDGEGPPAHGRLDAVHQDDVAVGAGRRRQQDPRGRPADPAAAVVGHDPGPVDLEVVVVLRVELRDRLGVPDLRQVVDRGRGRLTGVVPALEGSDHDRVAQLPHVLELDQLCLQGVVRVGVRGDGVAARTTRLRNPCPAAIHPADRLKADPPTRRSMTLSSRSDLFRSTLAERVVVADGAMGTMLQAADPSLDDFQGHEGCNEILNVTRPDIVRSVHDAYFAVGCRLRRDQHLRRQPRQPRRVRHRRPDLRAGRGRRADRPRGRRRPGRPPTSRAGCSARSAPAPSCRRSATRRTPLLRDAYAEQTPRACSPAGSTRVLVETSQDLLQAKAAVIGARRALADAGADAAGDRAGHRRDDRHDAARLRDRRRADRAGAARHRHDRAELRHRPGRDERAPAPPLPARPDRASPACPTPACPMLDHGRRALPADRRRAGRRARHSSSREFGLSPGRRLLRHDAGAPAPGRRAGRRPSRSAPPAPRPEPGVASLYQHVPFRQDTAYLSIGERTNANGSKAFREAMLEGRWDDCVEIARDQIRDGAHLLDLCVDYVGRDGVADMREVVGRFATASHAAARPRLHRARGARGRPGAARRPRGDQLGQLRGRRRPRLAVRRGSCRWSREHGAAVIALTIDEEGQARTAEWKVRVADAADRRPHRQLGDAGPGHHRRLPDLPDRAPARRRPAATASRRSRRSASSSAATPTCRPRSACPTSPSGSTRPPGRCSTRCSCTSASRPASTPRSCTPPRSCRWRGSPTSSARSRSTWSTTGAATATTRCRASSSCSRASTPRRCKAARAEELAALPLCERLAAAHHRRRAQRPRGRPRGRARRRPARARDHQRHLLDGHEDRRRAVRLAARCSCRSCCSPPR